MAMFNRFTERARKVILLAKEEAKRFNHDYIGTEHILLGLRKNSPAQGFWFVPGGIIRKGEGISSAFTRITTDELGITFPFKKAELKGVYEHFYDENAMGLEGISTHYVVLAYTLNVQNENDSFPLEQHEDMRWFPPKDCISKRLRNESVVRKISL